MINKFFSLPVIIFVFLLTGCVSTLGRFTVISTKNIDWNRASEFNDSNQHVEGVDMCHIIIVWSTKDYTKIKIENAIDNALQKVPGAIALTDAVLKQKAFFFPFIYGKYGFYIEGNIIVDPKYTLTDEESTKYLVFYTEDGKDFKKVNISEAEYLSYVK